MKILMIGHGMVGHKFIESVLEQTGDDIEEGGLSGAVGADQAVHLATLDGDAYIGQRLQAAKALGDASHVQHHILGFVCHWVHFCKASVQALFSRLLP